MFDKEYTIKVLDSVKNDLDRYAALQLHLRALTASGIQFISADDLSAYVTISSLQSWANRLGCGGILYQDGAFPKTSKYSIEEVAYILSCLLPPLLKSDGGR